MCRNSVCASVATVLVVLCFPLSALSQAGNTPRTFLPDFSVSPRGSEAGVLKTIVASPALGTDVNVSNLVGQESEVSIDINPTNPQNMVIVGHIEGFDNMNTFYTMDGGATWTLVPLGDSHDGLTSEFRFDPAVQFDDDGTVYVGYGAETIDAGGRHYINVIVCTSTDGGQTYPTCAIIDTTRSLPSFPQYFPGNDKWMIATGPTPWNPSQQITYIAWTENVLEGPDLDQRIVVSSSTDGGVTWSTPMIINDPSISGANVGNLTADPAVGPNGELYVSWANYEDQVIFIDRSTNAGTSWGTDVQITTFSLPFARSIPPQPNRGISATPTLDVDRSGGATDGRLYLNYCDLGDSIPNTDVIVRTSDDGGATWSSAVTVNDDGGSNSQFLPWLDVDQVSGIVSVVWYDARNDVNNKKVEVFHATSHDGGATFGTNTKVSDGQSDQSLDNPGRWGNNYLEYIGVAGYGCLAHVVWADNSTDLSDLDYFYDNVPLDDVPPMITCPADITVECTEIGGAPATHPDIAAFLAGATAVDNCDDSPNITNDAPGFFPLGPTTVTFTATDEAGNSNTCQADVTVVDTTPPDLTVVLNRDVLWPPNHKMADITAIVTVTDICCAMPTFVLTSVTSNEPDNGKGDGNTVNDIQGANLGTADVAFQLRSERSGRGDGRNYTVEYTAEDCSGNTATASAQVRVPHDHAGWAFASMGLEPDGIGFDPALDRFVLVIRSRPAEHELDENGDEILFAEAFDATALDVTKTYVGNVKGVVVPDESVEIDNNADGLMDLGLYYSTRAVNMILLESTPAGEGSVDLDDTYGTIGLHYTSAEGVDYLVPNIFGLGPPVPLIPEVQLRRSGVSERPQGGVPNVTALLPCYPNPFNPSTMIPFKLVTGKPVTLRVYDARGALVRILEDGFFPAGLHRVVWDGRDNGGQHAATGVYFVRFTAGAFETTQKIVLIK